MSKKILIVDDEAIHRDTQAALLEPTYEVSTASSGEEALQSIEQSTPHLVILDVNLGTMDGYQVLEGIRRNHADLPVIMVTARSEVEDAVRGHELGVEHYVTKPFNSDVYLDLVGRVLSG